MDHLKYSRPSDRPTTPIVEKSPIDFSPFLGTWVNTVNETTGFYKFDLTKENESYFIQAFTKESQVAWKKAKIAIFAQDINKSTPVAFHANYDFGFMESLVVGYVNLGLIILSTNNQFKDDSNRSNYFAREFYYHEDAKSA